MKDLIKNKIHKAESLKEIEEALICFLDQIRTEKELDSIGYVSGIVSSDGDEYIVRNMKILDENTEKLRHFYDFPLFSFSDIFDDDVFKRINVQNISYDEWIIFFRDILKSGYITDVFMTPRWEESKGAVDEYETSEKLGLRIHVLPSPLDTDL